MADNRNAAIDILPPSGTNIHSLSGTYSPIEKSAVILALLGGELGKPIVETLDDANVRRFMQAMHSIKLIPRPALLAIVAEFITSLKADSTGLRGGKKQAEELAGQLLSEGRAQRILGGNDKGDDKDAQVWADLRDAKTEPLVKYLNAQRPELVSMVLTKTGMPKAGELLAALSEDIVNAVANHMSDGINYDADIETAVASLLRVEFLGADKNENDDKQTISFMASIMGVIPKARRETLMEILTKYNPKTATKIRRGLLTFEDLPTRLPKTAVPIIFRDMDAKDVLAALKAGQDAEPEVTEFLYANISQRLAEQYKEQVEDLSALSEKEADNAIIGLMSFISQKEKAGTISYIDIPQDAAED